MSTFETATLVDQTLIDAGEFHRKFKDELKRTFHDALTSAAGGLRISDYEYKWDPPRLPDTLKPTDAYILLAEQLTDKVQSSIGDLVIKMKTNLLVITNQIIPVRAKKQIEFLREFSSIELAEVVPETDDVESKIHGLAKNMWNRILN